jgi:hypothetical protein
MTPMRGAGRDQQMNDEALSRKRQAILALHDLGSRDGATARSVRAAMQREGFSDAEIAEAARAYGSGTGWRE